MASTGSRVVLFSGATDTNGVLGDTWTFENGAWSVQRMPGPRIGAAIVNDIARNQVLMYGGYDTNGDGLDETWLLSPRGWSRYTGSPPTVPPGSIAYDPIARNVVLFSTGTGGLETWVWNGAWTKRTPTVSPPTTGPLAFDGVHLTLVASPAAQANIQTWTWTGTDWTQAAPPQAPTFREYACAGYDPVRNQLVLFGGQTNFVNFDETWTYDGTTWTQHDLAVRPPGRSGINLVWNPTRQRLVMIGDSRSAFDSWEWNGESWSIVAATNLAPNLERIILATTVDGSGVLLYGTHNDGGTYPVDEELWELAWGDVTHGERCNGSDLDGDELRGCADGDCWQVCTPSCPPQTSCAATAPRCGDGACDAAYESCRTCAMDCTCAAACGDFTCDPGETACPGDCP